ncbi:hypothetical protein G7Y79_00012g032380 [Physcia stellaris]|nr:hypothetical protein G7Y79_00012g032380 [Physcia stellaris]
MFKADIDLSAKLEQTLAKTKEYGRKAMSLPLPKKEQEAKDITEVRPGGVKLAMEKKDPQPKPNPKPSPTPPPQPRDGFKKPLSSNEGLDAD